jgi:hypothetical protein
MTAGPPLRFRYLVGTATVTARLAKIRAKTTRGIAEASSGVSRWCFTNCYTSASGVAETPFSKLVSDFELTAGLYRP